MSSARLTKLMRLDSSSDNGTTWAEVSDVWAEATQLTGEGAQHQWQVITRWSPTSIAIKPATDLGPTHRLVWVDGTTTRELRIMDVMKSDNKNHMLEMRCMEVVN